jgi:cell division protein FtsZ
VDGLAQYLPLILLLALVALGAAILMVLRRRRSAAEASTIRVIGVGGGGSNAVDAMVRAGTRGVAFIACNTDAQALAQASARRRLRIGRAATRGLGAGGDPDVGRQAAEEDSDRIARAVADADLLFVTAGLGGGTGSGAAPIVARLGREAGALTIGVVTRPFAFEGVKRRLIAEAAVESLRGTVDALIVIPNDRVRNVVDEGTPLLDAFAAVDEVLCRGVQGVIDIITKPGLVNLDFADVRAVLADGGLALMGTGTAAGPDRAAVAAREAIASPLLETDIGGAQAVLFNVTGGQGMTLAEVTAAADAIRADADPDASVVFGASFDETLGDEVRVTVVATGLRGRPAAADRSGEIESVRTMRQPGVEVPARARAPRPARTPAVDGHPAPLGNGRPLPTPAAVATARADPTASEPVPTAPEPPPTGQGPVRVERRLADDLEVPSFLRRRRTDR